MATRAKPRTRQGLLAFLLVAALTPAALADISIGGSFVDDNGNVHEGYVEAISAAGVTKG